MARPRFRLLSLIPVVFMLAGCWDLEEVDRRAFITTLGIDLTPRGRIHLTAQVPMPQKMLPPGQTSGGGQGKNFTTIGADARSVRGAFSIMQMKSDRDLVIQQNKSVIISEVAARQGVTPYLDFLRRSPKAPPQSLIFIADGVSADKVLSFSPASQILPATQFILAAQALPKADMTYFVPIWLLGQKLVHRAKDPYAPLIGLDEKEKTYILGGMAVFDGDRLSGKLDPGETQMFGLLAGLMRAGSLELALPDQAILSLRNVDGHPRIRIRIRGGQPAFLLEIGVSAAIGSLTDSRVDLTGADYRDLEKSIARIIRPRLAAVVRKLQEYHADVIDLGEQLRVQKQSLWRSCDWKKIYPTVDCRVSVQVKLERDGVLR